jgi:hypothetical protein
MTAVEPGVSIAHDIAARSPDYPRPNESEDLQPMRGNETSDARKSEDGGCGCRAPHFSTGP